MYYSQAASVPAWQDAMRKEFDALDANHTWDIVHLPPGKKPIGCKWVYKIKYKSDGTIERYKARLVIRGDTQVEGVDFTDTFSPVVKMTSVKCIIAVAVKNHWPLYQLDVNNAFLHGDLDEEVFMKLPPGLVVSDSASPSSSSTSSSSLPLVCKLKKSLYGLRQASRQWYVKLSSAFHSRGYRHSLNDYSLFLKGTPDSLVVVAVYVDDIIVTGHDCDEIAALKVFLDNTFKIKNLGSLHYFLGLEVKHVPGGIHLNQHKYVTDLLHAFDCVSVSPVVSPLDISIKLHADSGDLLPAPDQFRSLVGKLLFLTHTRPDICFTVQHLSQYLKCPRVPHMSAAMHVLRYLKGTPSLGLFYSDVADYSVTGYSDSDWAACPDTRRSVTGFCVLLGGSLISWKSKKQPVVSLSSAEAEYRALSKVTAELSWLSRLLADLGVSVPSPISVSCDSQAAVHIANNPVFHERTKHIEVDCHYVRTLLHNGFLKLSHVSTSRQLADLLTKALSGTALSPLLSKLMVVSPLQLEGGGGVEIYIGDDDKPTLDREGSIRES